MEQMPVREERVHRVHGATTSEADDVVAVEEPLEIRLAYEDSGGPGARVERKLSITMRTPGDDADLAVGFVCTEGLVASRDEVASVRPIDTDVVVVELRGAPRIDLRRLDRSFVTTSACGVCGKASLDAIRVPTSTPIAPGPVLPSAVVHALPAALRTAQSVFERTGGIHAAALFDPTGARRALREDVGRHNAVDKLIGAMFLEGALPLAGYALMVSGRASFELVQKARVAGIPILAAVGAPSSLAIDLARSEGMTVLGFVRDDRFNVYCGAERVAGSLSR
jgi:FdhD protein